MRDAASRGAQAEVKKFGAAAASSKAVMARSARELDRLASSDQELFSTYYKLLGAEVRLPHGNQWDLLRALADETLFQGYKEEIRFAALSLDGAGLDGYGECSFVFRDDMIAHRASVFEGNSAVVMKRHRYGLAPGFRAPWGERAKLCVAKLAGEIDPGTPETQFPGILLQVGPPPTDDFVEVHIWGPATLRTVEKVLMRRPRRQAIWKALRDRLKGQDVALEEIQ